tara:strand:- start:264 stop:749 length:486 start_codon:yes stop_codon:yes gene_type:complete
MYNRDQVNVINTINNISAFGRAHASEYDFSIDNEVSFTIDTSDVKDVSAIVKTMCVWLKGKNQNIYVERFCNMNESSITIVNPMLRTKDMDDDGNPIPSETIDYDDNVRDGSCIVQEINEHEADGHIIADIWDQVKPGAFRDWVSNTLVRVDGSFVEVEKV